MRGESCNHFFRDCEYLNQCTLSTELITAPLVPEAVHDDKIYDVEITLEQLIEGQLNKVVQPGELLDAARPFDGDEML